MQMLFASCVMRQSVRLPASRPAGNQIGPLRPAPDSLRALEPSLGSCASSASREATKWRLYQSQRPTAAGPKASATSPRPWLVRLAQREHGVRYVITRRPNDSRPANSLGFRSNGSRPGRRTAPTTTLTKSRRDESLRRPPFDPSHRQDLAEQDLLRERSANGNGLSVHSIVTFVCDPLFALCTAPPGAEGPRRGQLAETGPEPVAQIRWGACAVSMIEASKLNATT